MTYDVGTFRLGGELEVRRLGFGAMRVTSDRAEGVRVLRLAVELGANLIDTADIDGSGVSEELIAEALHPYDERLVIATKGGIAFGEAAAAGRTRDGRREYLREACAASLRRLRVERIDVYQLHRHDPDVPFEESVGALDEFRREGKIRFVGLSNVGMEQLDRARRVTEIGRRSETAGVNPERELRWLLERSPVMLPIPGTSSVDHLEQLLSWTL